MVPSGDPRREEGDMLSLIRILAASAAALALLAGVARAEDCPRGDLDKAYCDRDGDMVADAPTDPKKLVNPQTLIFAYPPDDDPAVLARVMYAFVMHFE